MTGHDVENVLLGPFSDIEPDPKAVLGLERRSSQTFLVFAM